MIAVTVAIYVLADGFKVAYFTEWMKPERHVGAVFASWVGGLVLFVIAGAFVAIVSLERPEKGPFEARARILFKRQTGGHVNYIVERIKQALEHYAERTSITVTITDFHAAEKKFKTARESTIVVRSYIDDARTTYATALRLKEVTPAPSGRDPNRLVFLKVNGSAVGSAELFDTEMERELRCTIEPDSTCNVESLTEFWVATAESNEHSPTRYTQALTLKFHNHSNVAVLVKYRLRGGAEQMVNLNPGDRFANDSLIVLDLLPDEQAFAYQIMSA